MKDLRRGVLDSRLPQTFSVSVDVLQRLDMNALFVLSIEQAEILGRAVEVQAGQGAAVMA